MAVTDPNTRATSTVSPLNPSTITGLVPDLVAAVLPTSRSVRWAPPPTAFATIINAGTIGAIACKMALLSSVPATLSYRATDATTNQVIGLLSTPVSIAAGAGQNFVFGLTPTGEILPTDVQLSLACGGTSAPVLPGINTLLLSASASPVPDIRWPWRRRWAIPASVNIPGSSGVGIFAVATVNVGVGSAITASADTGRPPCP